MNLDLAADRTHLHVRHVDVPPGTPLTLLLSGRRIWSFEAPEMPTPDRPEFSVAWPAALADRLTGWADLSIEGPGRSSTATFRVRFDDVDRDFELVESQSGAQLTVNKWGRLAQPFDSRGGNVINDVLDDTERLISLLRDASGIDLFVTGGTLLGPVRDGAILPGDDDADLAYLSAHTNPSDVARESFDIERTLLAHGYEVNRHSSVHLQLMFPGYTPDNRYYIDIFSYFVCNGWFYGPFHARQPASQVTVLPLAPLDVNGRRLPSPANPAQMLDAIYGPTWQVPNPAFRFVTPPDAARRFFWWFNHFDVDRENWEDTHREQVASLAPFVISEFARFVGSRLPDESSVVDLGCGLGADSYFFSYRGHAVTGADYSRPALLHAQSLREHAAAPAFLHTNLNSVRHAVRLRSHISGSPGPHMIYARRLFNALPPLGWDVTLQLVRSVLRGDPRSRSFIEVAVDDDPHAARWTEYRGVDWSRMVAELTRFGLTIEDAQLAHVDSDGATVNRAVVAATGGDTR